ncbi:hypothetical protein P5G51_002990 [Virgibacillus sp. 179-BFC.A HS]|uniref:Uncharacterized protein n=1 Tax=Tigheibacillus jepli TaxID=3035914 RepID=A0ABU5CE66_9BACI|nr:hypothetical protein [Virgibacillus sp. 179-BFC.A HS]MDY0404510.1 hypothetical protein [Virgibacillus sp. 179-BFC.A HS]
MMLLHPASNGSSKNTANFFIDCHLSLNIAFCCYFPFSFRIKHTLQPGCHFKSHLKESIFIWIVESEKAIGPLTHKTFHQNGNVLELPDEVK